MTLVVPATESPTAPAGVAAWRILFRMLAGFFVLFFFAFWAAAGWNLGLTRTILVPIKQTNRLTGIEQVTYQDHFMPGVELLGGGLFLCIALLSITFLRAKSGYSTSPSHTS